MLHPPDPEPGVIQERTVLDLSGFPLRYVEDEVGCSLYLDRDGDEVYLQHGTGRRLVPLSDVDLLARWRTWTANERRLGFKDWLAERVVEAEDVEDQVGFCADCGDPAWAEDMYGTANGDVCEGCDEHYFTCGCCEERHLDREATWTYHEEAVCDRCRRSSYHLCNYCEEWVSDDVDHYHEEEEESCSEGCDSPQLSFTIRNDGHDPLPNDTRVTLQLPAGTISEEGMIAIAEVIQAHYRTLISQARCDPGGRTSSEINTEFHPWWLLSFNLADAIGDRWQTKDGNFTKRLSRHAYKTFSLKVPPTLISEVGNIASAHSQAADVLLETTRDLNMSPEDFYHEDSCWWGSYFPSRCALKSNGGFGLRSFKEQTATWPDGSVHTYDEVTGRAWVLPMRLSPGSDKDLVPTFETQEPDAYVVFNGYGALGGYTPARLLSHMVGMTYRKIGFKCAPMYVNSDAGYLVAPEELASKYTDGAIDMRVPQHSPLYETEQNESKELTNA